MSTLKGKLLGKYSRPMKHPHTVDGRNPKQPPGMVLKPYKIMEYYYQPQLVSLPDFWLPSTVFSGQISIIPKPELRGLLGKFPY